MGTIYIDGQFKRFPKLNTISKDQIGQPNGVAGLDENGKIPESQLPGYVDDVIEVESYDSLPTIGESGKIYVTANTNLTYRWSGSQYMNISSTIALGETAETAYPGDKGKQNRIDIDDLKTQKADKTEVYTKQESDSKYLSEIPSQYVTEDQLDLKVNKTEVYTKEEVQQQILDSKYVHPNVSHIPEGGNIGQILVNNGDGEAKWDYMSEAVTISVSLSDTNTVEGVVVTLQIGPDITTYDYSEPIQVNIPLGLQYEVSASEKVGYSTPDSVTLTASKNSRNIVLKYCSNSEQSVTFNDNDNNPILVVDNADTSWIRGKRCLVRPTGSGVAICYLDENNSNLFHDGSTIAKLDGSMGEWMTDIPEYWYKVDETEDGKHILHISNTEVPGYKHSGRVLLGCTLAYYDEANDIVKSIAGVIPTIDSKTSIKTAQWWSKQAEKKGAGWDLSRYSTRQKLVHLFTAKYGTRDPQSMELFGIPSKLNARQGGSTAYLGNNDGCSTSSMTFLGAEDIYGNIWERISGIHTYMGSTTVTYFIYEDYISSKYGKDLSQDETVRKITNTKTNIYGTITKLKWGEYGDIIPIEVSKSVTVDYSYCDMGFLGISASNLYTSIKVSGNGAGYSAGKMAGIFAWFEQYQDANHHDNSGGRLQYNGNIRVISNPQDFLAPSLSEGTSLDYTTLHYITPEEFGAKGDNSNDDTDALNKCFTTAREKGLNVKALQSYKTSSSVTIYGNYKDYEINYINCSSTTEPAIIFIGRGNKLSIQRISAQFEALQMSDISGVPTRDNTLRIGTIAVNGDAVVWKNSNHASFQNTFYFNNITCNKAGSCFEQEKYSHGYISENNYYGGYVGNCIYFFHGTGSNNKFYNIELEQGITIGWWLTGVYGAQIFADRHAEIVLEDGATLLKLGTGEDTIVDPSANNQGISYYSTPQIPIDSIDISGAYIKAVIIGDTTGPITNMGMGYFSPILTTSKTTNATNRQVLAKGFYTWGRRFIWKYFQKASSNLIEQVTDFRDSIGLKKALPYKMYITVPDSELYLHSAYCLFGQDTFEIVQDDVNKVKIYDSDGNLIWNGWEQPAGNYQFTHMWENDLSNAKKYQVVQYDYADCYWKVTKLDEIDDKLKWKIIE